MKNASMNLSDLVQFFTKKNNTQKLQFLDEIDTDDYHFLKILFKYLHFKVEISKNTVDFIDGYIYQILMEVNDNYINELLSIHFKEAIIDLRSNSGINYIDLHNLLLLKKFQEADRLTNEKLCQLANLLDNSRQWLYFTDIPRLPIKDILIIDKLWLIYSKGKFGFSAQYKVWLGVNKNWNLLWNKLGWQKQGNLCRYPSDFVWNLDAPEGHLPLFNQLRGNTVFAALLNLNIWN
nr:hypothetical protein [Boldiaceae sp.]